MDTSALTQSHLRSAYTDIASLQEKLPKGKAGLEAAASQFESVFLDMWLQSMRAAGEVFGEGSYLSSAATDMHQEMLDHQLAVHLAQSGGIGLRDVILKQLAPPAAEQRSVSTSPPPRATVDPKPIAPKATGEAEAARFDGSANGFKAAGFESMEEFLDAILPVVERALAALGFNPVAVVAQAALETGWGSRLIHRTDGEPSHNLFGVKSHGWSGERVRVATLEHELGRFVERSDEFRAYDSWQDAVLDYAQFLSDNPRYARVMEQAGDAEGFAEALQAAGYATDPRYADKLKQVVGQVHRLLAR